MLRNRILGAMVFVAIGVASGQVLGMALGLQNPRPMFQIGGQVTSSETGEPIGGAVVIYEYFSQANRRYELSYAETDSNGYFLIQNLEKAAVYMRAKAPGYGTTVALVITHPVIPTEVAMQLDTAATVNGTVLDPRGQPVIGAMIRAEYLDKLSSRLARDPTTLEEVRALGLRTIMSEEMMQGEMVGAGEGAVPGIFSLSIEPWRPFRIICAHDALGEVEGELMQLEPGEQIADYTVQFPVQ